MNKEECKAMVLDMLISFHTDSVPKDSDADRITREIFAIADPDHTGLLTVEHFRSLGRSTMDKISEVRDDALQGLTFPADSQS